jgi:hypothetical protein
MRFVVLHFHILSSLLTTPPLSLPPSRLCSIIAFALVLLFVVVVRSLSMTSPLPSACALVTGPHVSSSNAPAAPFPKTASSYNFELV